MAMLAVLLALVTIPLAHAQLLQCANGGHGPCLADNTCAPASQTCITTATGKMCCENTQIIVPGAPTVTPPCVDLVNPRTGVSDCQNVAYLCNNPNYYNLMTQQCPKTCNRCPGSTVVPPGACQDLVDPRSGVSNCVQMAPYCQNPYYINLMKQQCPKTCGYCT